LPLLALALTSCAGKQRLPQQIPALAQARHCPAYPLPPKALIEAPEKVDFLPKTPSPPPSRPSSSMN
jgi:hypothetical protein